MKILKIRLIYGQKYLPEAQTGMQAMTLDHKFEFDSEGKCDNNYCEFLIEAKDLPIFIPCEVTAVIR